MATLAATGNEITDATRALGIEGDGLASDSSFGCHPASTNLHPNGGFETNVEGWAANGGGAPTRVNTSPKCGSWCALIDSGTTSAEFASLTKLRRGAVSGWVRAASSGVLTATLSTPAGTLVTDNAIAVTTAWTRFKLFWLSLIHI